MARTVYGYITDKNGNPAAGLRVKALDSDVGPDDLMGIAITDSNGYYEIHYEGGHWDPAPHWWTIWRPDIYIRVSAPVNGRCDQGEWKSDANWIHLQDSRKKNNHKHRNNLRRDLQLTNYPLRSVEVHTFQRGIDMWSEIDFFFHGTAFGCAPNGDKVEWSYWTIGGPPKIATRCWYPPNRKCTDADYKKIREQGMAPYPVEYGQYALKYLIKNDDVDEEAEKALIVLLKTIQKFSNEGKTEETKAEIETFKLEVKKEYEKKSITETAKFVLLTFADKYLDQ